jgi:SAM-dependent methyltransferase
MTALDPIDVPTRQTAEFIASHVPRGARILEIGCGAGHVAIELGRRGYEVVAIDTNRGSVSSAVGRGAQAVEGSWPGFESGPVDAVVFARSLHHIAPLDEAVARCKDVLPRGGFLLVEDFAFDAADLAAVDWFIGTLRSDRGRSLIDSAADGFVNDLLASTDPTAVWQRNHDHDLHRATAMRSAIACHFAIVSEHEVPYLYRYLVPVLPQGPEAAGFVAAVLAEDQRLGSSGAIRLIGRRFVGLCGSGDGSGVRGRLSRRPTGK